MSLISRSKPVKTLFDLRTISTLAPSELKIPANSRAIYPPPTIIIFFGHALRSKASFDEITSSFPGKSGIKGLPPTAIRILLAEYFLYLTLFQ